MCKFKDLQKQALKLFNARSYSTVFKIENDGSVIYSDGIALILVHTRHSFTQDTCVNIKTGMPSNVNYPAYTKVAMGYIAHEELELYRIIEVGRLIKPNSKKPTIIDMSGNLTKGPGLDLIYANLAVALGCTDCHRDSSGMYRFQGPGVDMYVGEYGREV